jgi:hypothetical protein
MKTMEISVNSRNPAGEPAVPACLTLIPSHPRLLKMSNLAADTAETAPLPGRLEVTDYSRDGWADPAAAGRQSRAYCERLEEGYVLYFPQTPFELPAADCAFLTEIRQSGSGFTKNISYRPLEDQVRGAAAGGGERARLRAILRDYSRRVVNFAADFLRPYARGWRLDFASFRSLEEQGRDLPWKARGDLLHVDAFPTRPMNGDRILRIFTNINPRQSRVWLTGEPFDRLAERFAAPAGLARAAAAARSPWRSLRRLGIRLGAAAGLPLADHSPYDRFMLGFHDYLKGNAAFQQSCPRSRWEFPPGSTWLVFTDMVPHAVLAGRFALEQTFIVSRRDLVRPEKAPVHILEALSGTKLTH